jgi:hypothetical protein
LIGGSPQCREAVASAFAELEHKFDHERPQLKQIFNTCGEVKTDGDVYLLHDYISDDFMVRCFFTGNPSLVFTPFHTTPVRLSGA